MKKIVVFAVLSALAFNARAGQAITAAIGYSAAKDSLTAGREAAEMAVRSGGSSDNARLVLVFDHAADREQMLKGVAEVFPPSMIYGCSAYAPITPEGNDGNGVGVCVLAGDISVAGAMAGIEAGQLESGKRIGETLKPAVNAEKENFLILLGDCHVPANDEVARGAQAALGEMFPMLGAAASAGQLVYYQGKIEEKANIGILISGDFSLGFSRMQAKTREDTIATAGDALWAAAGHLTEKPFLTLVFNCGGRLGVMGEESVREVELLREAGILFAGFYGSGETGPERNGVPARGGGFQIAVCALAQGSGKASPFDPARADTAALAAALSGNDALAARDAAKKLKQCGQRAAPAIEALSAAAMGKDPLLAAYAIEAICAIAPDKALDAIMAGLESGDARRQVAALQGAQRLKSPDNGLREQTQRLLSETDAPFVRLEAARAVGALGDDSAEAIEALAACHEKAMPGIGFPLLKSLVETCGKLPPAAATAGIYIAAIKTIYPVPGDSGWLYNNERAAVRIAAVKGLARLGKDAAGAVPDLEEAIDAALFGNAAAKPSDKDGEAVMGMIKLLGDLGEDAFDTLPLLEKIFESKDQRVNREIRGAAWESMQKIEPQTAPTGSLGL